MQAFDKTPFWILSGTGFPLRDFDGVKRPSGTFQSSSLLRHKTVDLWKPVRVDREGINLRILIVSLWR
jgi:hypothetical protein